MSRRTAPARAGQDRASLYDEIADKIVAELEAGRVPWVQPWGTAATDHPSRLGRDMSGGFGTKKYAFQELAAEMNAALQPAWTGSGANKA